MNRRYVSVSDCIEGDILAKDIFNQQGTVIVSKDTVLNKYIIDRLKLWDVKYIYVYGMHVASDTDSPEEKLARMESAYRCSVREIKELVCSIAEGRKLDEEKLNNISSSIISNINETHTIISLLDKVKSTDEYTYTHCMNVSLYSMLIGKWLKLPQHEIKKLISAGLLHDVGKTQVPSEILNKPGRLLPEEFDIMKKHSLYGYDMLKNIRLLDQDIALAVLQHHEREDGSGYPLRLTADKISIYSKIIAVSDVYDAVTSDRVYKKRATPFEAFKIFRDECVNSFNLSIVNTFLNNLASYYTGSKVMLSSGNIGEVAFIPPNNICKPIIRIRDTFLDLAKEKNLEIAYFIDC
ncbi:MAG: HD-GYP domain-containing protein [Clostridia bacterium]|nr:HD-GYP domain-containing protein [Clostridia bacterium]